VVAGAGGGARHPFELTGEPGDMVFCHPVMVHCAAPNRGAWPRFMRIKTQVLTHEGRTLRGERFHTWTGTLPLRRRSTIGARQRTARGRPLTSRRPDRTIT
jgi:hypothetical protein